MQPLGRFFGIKGVLGRFFKFQKKMILPIKFSSNHNKKLNCKYFTSIRKKEEYHPYKCNDEYNIYLKGVLFKRAKIKYITPLKYDDITETMANIDFGSDLKSFKNFLNLIYNGTIFGLCFNYFKNIL